MSTTNRFPGQHSNHGQRPHGKAVFPPGEPTVPTSCCGGLRLGMRPASPPPPPQSALTTPSSSFSCPHRTIANICRLSSRKLQRVFVLFTSFHKLRSRLAAIQWDSIPISFCIIRWHSHSLMGFNPIRKFHCKTSSVDGIQSNQNRSEQIRMNMKECD